MTRRVLIVDDNATNLRLAANVLELEGFAVDQAVDAEQALQQLARAPPDLILMDIALPGKDGLALTREIKADPRWRSIPVVALTAFAMKGDEEKALAAGCCGYLTKPIDTRRFADQVGAFIDTPLQRVLIADDHPANLRLLRAQLETEGIEVVEATNGEDALRQLREGGFDGVVSDILMPRMDGYRLCLEVRRDAELAALPFVLYTSTYDSPADRKLALSAGADSYLTKPAPVSQILSALQQARGRQRTPPAAGEDIASPVLKQYSESLIRKLEEKNLELGQAYEGLAEAEARLAGLVESAMDAIIVVDVEQKVRLFNAAAERMFGCERAEVLGRTLDPFLPERFRQDHQRRVAEFSAGLQDARSMGARVVWARRKDGHEFPTEASLSRLMTSRGWLFTVFLRDVTERYRAEQALASREARLRRVNRMLSVLSGINNLIVRAKLRDELLQQSCRVAVEAGNFPKAWIALIDPDSRRLRFAAGHGAPADYFSALQARIEDQDAPQHAEWLNALGKDQPVVINDLQSDPRMLPEALGTGSRSLAAVPISQNSRTAGVLVLHADESDFFDEEEVSLLQDLASDISHALQHLDQAERIRYLARFDALTGLPNRKLFSDRLARGIAGPGEPPQATWVVMIDVERFQRVNETLGRPAGDQLLQQIAGRLQQECANAARMDSDRFAFKLHEPEGLAASLHCLDGILHRCFAQPFRIEGQELRLGCRAGIAAYPEDGSDAEALLRNAEAALRQARTQNERRVFYAPKLNARAADALALETRLRRAILQQQFALHYQPRVRLSDGRLCGVEALIRWHDPERGLVAPGEFIPVLEETGLIAEVGTWALHQALGDQQRWREAGLDSPAMAVNVSPLQLRCEDFVDKVLAARAACPGALLELEITESVLMDGVEGNVESLDRLRAEGVRVSVDDFGTGYSSLAYVARLPINALKIDRSFVSAINGGQGALAIAASIVALAHALNLHVVAEGVETAAQAQALIGLGCDEAQGFLFSRPVPADQLAALLAEPARNFYPPDSGVP